MHEVLQTFKLGVTIYTINPSVVSYTAWDHSEGQSVQTGPAVRYIEKRKASCKKRWNYDLDAAKDVCVEDDSQISISNG